MKPSDLKCLILAQRLHISLYRKLSDAIISKGLIPHIFWLKYPEEQIHQFLPNSLQLVQDSKLNLSWLSPRKNSSSKLPSSFIIRIFTDLPYVYDVLNRYHSSRLSFHQQQLYIYNLSSYVIYILEQVSYAFFLKEPESIEEVITYYFAKKLQKTVLLTRFCGQWNNRIPSTCLDLRLALDNYEYFSYDKSQSSPDLSTSPPPYMKISKTEPTLKLVGTIKNLFARKPFVNLRLKAKFILYLFYKLRLYLAFFLANKCRSVNNPDGLSLVFFLHFQPELSSSPLAGIYANQLLAIAKIIEHLGPSDVLYIKEHPATFWMSSRTNKYFRPLTFYSTISNLDPRVRILSAKARSNEALLSCDLVVTLTGTVIKEAILNSKPAIVFGDSPYPRVSGVYNYDDLISFSANESNFSLSDLSVDSSKVSEDLSFLTNHGITSNLDDFDTIKDMLHSNMVDSLISGINRIQNA